MHKIHLEFFSPRNQYYIGSDAVSAKVSNSQLLTHSPSHVLVNSVKAYQ